MIYVITFGSDDEFVGAVEGPEREDFEAFASNLHWRWRIAHPHDAWRAEYGKISRESPPASRDARIRQFKASNPEPEYPWVSTFIDEELPKHGYTRVGEDRVREAHI